MHRWSKEELQEIASSDELRIAPLREDGKTYRPATTIWCVAVDDALHVRAYNGRDSCWYQAALRQKAGRIHAAGITKLVTFVPALEKLSDRVDEAYREKYRRSPYLSPMVGAAARSATLEVLPSEAES